MIKKICRYYFKEKKLLVSFLTASFFVTLLDLYGPVIVQNLIDISIPKKDVKEFMFYSFVLLGIYIIRFGVSLYSSSRGQLMGNKIKFAMRENLFKKILNQPDKFFMEKQSGDLISRITNDLENVSSLLYRGLEDFLFSVLSIIGALILMVNFNGKLTLITMLPLPIAVYFTVVQNKKLKKGYFDVRTKISILTSGVHDTLKTIFFIKDNLLEEDSLEKFSQKNKSLLKTEEKNIFNTSALMSGVNLYNQITQLIVIFAGGYLHIKGQLSLGVIVSFILLTNRFRIYLLRLMGLIDVFQRGATGIVRFFEIMNIPDEEEGNICIKDEIKNIRIENLNFAFGEKQILKNISFEVKKGEKIALVGESGAGKTTIFSLLKKTFSSDENSIFINNNPVNNIDRKSLLKKIAVVDHKENIMNESLLENIKIIKKDADEEEIQRVFSLSHLKDMVETLENKEDTKLGEGGVNLSSGQKQRLAIARIFLKNPDVILLDEGTSALDNILEKKITENIFKEFEDKIIITIAHRLNTIKSFDKIIVLDNGEIVEKGNFCELMEKKGYFYKMYSAN